MVQFQTKKKEIKQYNILSYMLPCAAAWSNSYSCVDSSAPSNVSFGKSSLSLIKDVRIDLDSSGPQCVAMSSICVCCFLERERERVRERVRERERVE